jgi:hypothetical protein
MDFILNPVDATISILHQADLLGIPGNEPVGVTLLVFLPTRVHAFKRHK